MNRELFDKLSKFESNFKTIIESDYTRNINKKDRKFLLSVYKELTNDVSPKLIHCSNCIKEILKPIAKAYYEYKGIKEAPLAIISLPMEEVPDTVIELIEEPKKPKKQPKVKEDKDNDNSGERTDDMANSEMD